MVTKPYFYDTRSRQTGSMTPQDGFKRHREATLVPIQDNIVAFLIRQSLRKATPTPPYVVKVGCRDHDSIQAHFEALKAPRLTLKSHSPTCRVSESQRWQGTTSGMATPQQQRAQKEEAPRMRRLLF